MAIPTLPASPRAGAAFAIVDEDRLRIEQVRA
jgi:hypothetical protein